MNGTLKLKDGFEVPTVIVHDQYVLEVLAPKHNDIDYDAWTSSIKELQGIFGPKNKWPEEGYTKEQNLNDLDRHYREFEESIAYAYTILSPDRKSCIGCLYIRPTPVVTFDTRVDFWFRNSHNYLESLFFDELKRWLKSEWQFSNALFPGRETTWEEYYQLVDKSM